MFRSSRYRSPSDRPNPRLAWVSWLLIGLMMGIGGGLAYSWLVSPIIYSEIAPARLAADYRAEYILLVSQNYLVTGNWPQAQARLMALDSPDVAAEVTAQFEQYLREGRPAGQVRALAMLAAQLGSQSPALSLFGPTPLPPAVTPLPTATVPTLTPTPQATPSPTRRPTNTPTLPPTATPLITLTPSPPPVYRLLAQEQLCDPAGEITRIEVETVDGLLQPLPGVEVVVFWDEGEDHFFTGFKPQRGLGYGDFTMLPNTSYSVYLADGSPTVSGLQLELCDDGFLGGWRLTFQNLIVIQATPEL